jgi:hypothetical protein
MFLHDLYIMSNFTPLLYRVKWLFFPLGKKPQPTQAFSHLFSPSKIVIEKSRKVKNYF